MHDRDVVPASIAVHSGAVCLHTVKCYQQLQELSVHQAKHSIGALFQLPVSHELHELHILWGSMCLCMQLTMCIWLYSLVKDSLHALRTPLAHQLLLYALQNLLQTEMPPAAAARTTRIFVARIPQSVTDTQFRSYFEKFGRLQDAYMPRDHSRQMYRGIGFVTFASPESVEKVMACKHW